MNSKPNKSKTTNDYDDVNIPEVDLPYPGNSANSVDSVEPLPESSRPRKDEPEGH